MQTVLHFLAGVSIGIIIFQSAFVAPTVFKQLKDGAGGPFLRALFPKFFLALSVLGLALALSAGLSNDLPVAIAGLLAMVCGATAYLIIPATNRAKDRGYKSAFRRLHTASVLLMLVIAAANIYALF